MVFQPLDAVNVNRRNFPFELQPQSEEDDKGDASRMITMDRETTRKGLVDKRTPSAFLSQANPSRVMVEKSDTLETSDMRVACCHRRRVCRCQNGFGQLIPIRDNARTAGLSQLATESDKLRGLKKAHGAPSASFRLSCRTLLSVGLIWITGRMIGRNVA